jgi:DNA-directed RNA polymerase specialized sigma24 family protein
MKPQDFDDRSNESESSAPIGVLFENRRQFLRYLERRVGDRMLAEDILQDAFAKVVKHPEQAPENDGVVPWFYRTLRNAAVDQFRRRRAARRVYEAFARELESQDAPASELESESLRVRVATRSDVEAGICRSPPGHRNRRSCSESIRRAEGPIGGQRRGPGVPSS